MTATVWSRNLLGLCGSAVVFPSLREAVGRGQGWGAKIMPSSRRTDGRVPRARRLRRDATAAERKLWQLLRQTSLHGTHFRRQATLGPYFADFACHESRLVIEVDGGQHALPANVAADEVRTSYFRTNGYTVLRFWNNDVLDNIEGVMTVILEAISRQGVVVPPTPDPSPPQAGGGEPRRTV